MSGSGFNPVAGHAQIALVSQATDLDVAEHWVADPDDAPIIAAAKRAKVDALAMAR